MARLTFARLAQWALVACGFVFFTYIERRRLSAVNLDGLARIPSPAANVNTHARRKETKQQPFLPQHKVIEVPIEPARSPSNREPHDPPSTSSSSAAADPGPSAVSIPDLRTLSRNSEDDLCVANDEGLRRPVIILVPEPIDEFGVPDSDANMQRTAFIDQQAVPAQPAPPKPVAISNETDASATNATAAIPEPKPAKPHKQRPLLPAFTLPNETEFYAAPRFAYPALSSQICPVHRVPASFADESASCGYSFDHGVVSESACSGEAHQWIRKGYPEFMVGFATSPARALHFLRPWSDWLPSAWPSADSSSSSGNAVGTRNRRRDRIVRRESLQRATTPTIVLVPPGMEEDEAWKVRTIAAGAGYDITIRAVAAQRYEARYFALVEELWEEAMARERDGAALTKWFMIADDDTYFLSMDAVARTVEGHDYTKPLVIGAASEFKEAMRVFGGQAFGGGGIFLSRELMKRLNVPGRQRICRSLFRTEFGGDGMISKCIALTLDETLEDAIHVDPSLHQLDIRGNGMGVFEAGWRFTTWHHWASWFRLMPKTNPFVPKDDLALVNLLGKAARAVGAENWGRRYVFRQDGDTNVDAVLSLGYSLTTYSPGALNSTQLAKVEHTFDHTLVVPTRPALAEGLERRTYLLQDVRTYSMSPHSLNPRTDIAVFSHVNEDGEVVDVVWDARPRAGTPTKKARR